MFWFKPKGLGKTMLLYEMQSAPQVDCFSAKKTLTMLNKHMQLAGIASDTGQLNIPPAANMIFIRD